MPMRLHDIHMFVSLKTYLNYLGQQFRKNPLLLITPRKLWGNMVDRSLWWRTLTTFSTHSADCIYEFVNSLIVYMQLSKWNKLWNWYSPFSPIFKFTNLRKWSIKLIFQTWYINYCLHSIGIVETWIVWNKFVRPRTYKHFTVYLLGVEIGYWYLLF